MSEWRDTIRTQITQLSERNNTQEFDLQELLEFSESVLQERFPNNNTPEATTRRTLQELRDRGEIEFVGYGRYQIIDNGDSDGPPEPDDYNSIKEATEDVLSKICHRIDEDLLATEVQTHTGSLRPTRRRSREPCRTTLDWLDQPSVASGDCVYCARSRFAGTCWGACQSESSEMGCDSGWGLRSRRSHRYRTSY